MKLDPVKLRMERARRQWTATEFAAKAGIARETLSKAESNGVAHLDTAVKLSRALGMAIEDLLDDEMEAI